MKGKNKEHKGLWGFGYIGFGAIGIIVGIFPMLEKIVSDFVDYGILQIVLDEEFVEFDRV